MRRMFTTVMFIGLGMFLLACGARPPELGQQIVVERFPDSRPRWIAMTPPDEGDRMFFIGVKTHASSLENGNTDARQNAIQKIVEYVGGTGMVDYTKARVEAGLTDEGQAGNYVEDGYRFLAESIVNGTREDETYYEHVKEFHTDGWHYFYNYYVKLYISRQDLVRAAQQAFERQAAEARARNDARAEAFANRLRSQLTQDATSPNP